MARVGRKPKLTPEVIKRLENALLAGNYIETACDYAGISRSIFYAWMAEAEQERPKKIILELKDTVARARAEAEMRNVTKIQKAADDSWQAAAWWLERSHSKKWGRQQKVELSGADGGAINVALDAKQKLLDFLDAKQE
jgi:hypothetical protein